MTVEGSTNTEVFLTYLDRVLCPAWRPGQTVVLGPPERPQSRGRARQDRGSGLSALGAAEFIEVVEQKLLPGLERPAVLVLDHGSLHRAKLIQARRAGWKARGLRLLFLPPYSPHFKRIETLWRLMKHRWLSPEAHANCDSL